MSSARAGSYWWFQVAFWLVAGSALFVSGLSQTSFGPALVRNVFLTIAGFLSSFFLAALIDRFRGLDGLRMRLVAFPAAYVVALLCVVSVNAIGFWQHDVPLEEVGFGRWFAGVLNFALVCCFWSELFIQQVHLKGRPAIRPEEREPAGEDRLVVDHRGGKLRLLLTEVSAILAAGDYVEVIAGGRRYLDRRTIAALAERLAPAGFLRVHRSAIVNPTHVRRVTALAKGRYQLEFDGPWHITSSRNYEDTVRNQLL